MAIVTQNPDEIKTSETVSAFMRRFSIANLIARCGAYKEKGISVLELFLAVFQNVFSDRSMYRQIKTGRWDHDFSKNTVYRFRNCGKIHWERFTALLSVAVANVLRPLTSEKRKETFIVDDTLYARTGYRRTELCAKVYDHSDGRYRKGFRLLTLGWSDGNTFLPVAHRLLSSANEKNVLGTVEKQDSRTLAGRRRKQARKKGTEVMMDLLKSAVKAGHRADYVLFDTWFSNPKQIAAVKELKMDVIAMVKKTGKIHYLYGGEMLDIKQIFARNRKRRGRSRYLLSVDVTVISGKQEIPAKMWCWKFEFLFFDSPYIYCSRDFRRKSRANSPPDGSLSAIPWNIIPERRRMYNGFTKKTHLSFGSTRFAAREDPAVQQRGDSAPSRSSCLCGRR